MDGLKWYHNNKKKKKKKNEINGSENSWIDNFSKLQVFYLRAVAFHF